MIVVIMSSEQQVPGNSEPNAVVEHPEEEPTSWVSRHSRSLLGAGVFSVVVILGVTIRSFLRRKD
jgi:hypothetical protein